MYSWFFDSSILVSYLSIRDGVVIILSKSRRLNWISLYFRILLSSNRSFLSFVSSLVNIFVDHWSPLSAHSTEIDIVDDDQTERRFFKLRRAYSACRASTFQPLRVNGRCSFSLFFFFRATGKRPRDFAISRPTISRYPVIDFIGPADIKFQRSPTR